MKDQIMGNKWAEMSETEKFQNWMMQEVWKELADCRYFCWWFIELRLMWK